jgi:predicted nucleic acid-binding protein
MAASAVLVDSSYYIGLMRARQDPLRSLALAAEERDLVVCGAVRCEVGRAIRHSRTLVKFHAFWDVMINVPTNNDLWAEAERTLWDLDRSGIVLPLTDVVIACCAIKINAVVLTFDKHFAAIPGVRSVDRLDL